jgi:hypothetical protein
LYNPDIEIEVIKKVRLINTVFVCIICNCCLPSFLVPNQKNLKFTQEGRFSFGCCIKTDENDVEQGVRCKPFNYSGKKILDICMYEDVIEDEIK